MSFGSELKYVVGSCVEICHLVGHRNMSSGLASKICHFVGSRNISFCRHLVGCQNISLGESSKYVICSGIEINHLGGYQNKSFGRSDVCHLVRRRITSFG